MQGSCLCSQVQNSGKVIYCYGDLLPRHNSIIAPEENKQDSSTSPKDLIAAQLGVWTCGLLALYDENIFNALKLLNFVFQTCGTPPD